MKAIIFILGILFITNSNAQKFDCTSKTAVYQELLKAGKTAESFDTWSPLTIDQRHALLVVLVKDVWKITAIDV